MQAKWSGIGIVDGSGKLGGSVMGRNKSGSVVRKYTKPNNPRTNAQLAQRGTFSGISSKWRDLGDEKRATWNSAAASGQWNYTNKVGDIVQPTGNQLYGRLNGEIASVSGAEISEAPLKVQMPALTIGALDVSTSAATLAYTGTLGSDFSIKLFASGYLSQGISRPSGLKQLGVYTAATPLDIETDLLALNGSVQVSSRVFVEMWVVSELTGQSMLVGQASTIVTA